MYLLNEAPIFLEFMDRFLKKANSKIKIKATDELFLYDKCVCNKHYCNSFILKTKRKIQKDFYMYHTIKTNKGTFGIELFDNGKFIFVATENKNLPFKKEHKILFKHKSSIKKNLIKNKQKQKLSKKDKKIINRFFKDFKIDPDYKIHYYVDDCIIDYI